MHTTDWYPAGSGYNQELFMSWLCRLRDADVIALWTDVSADGQPFRHIEWLRYDLPEFRDFLLWMAAQPGRAWRGCVSGRTE